MRTVEYVIPLGENARKRHYHKSRAGKIVAFVVQLEIHEKGKWRVVIRYDSAHGFAHIDHYSRSGKKTKKPIELELTEALTVAEEDIKNNWRTYRNAFLEDGWSMQIMEQKHAILVTEFGRYIAEHPDFAAQIPPGAQIILQVKGDETYNEWSRKLAERQREPGQCALFVTVKGLRPARSRLLDPEIAAA